MMTRRDHSPVPTPVHESTFAFTKTTTGVSVACKRSNNPSVVKIKTQTNTKINYQPPSVLNSPTAKPKPLVTSSTKAMEKLNKKDTSVFVPIANSMYQVFLTDKALQMLGGRPLRPFEPNKWLDQESIDQLAKDKSGNPPLTGAYSESDDEDFGDDGYEITPVTAFLMHEFANMLFKKDCRHKVPVLDIYQALTESFDEKKIPDLIVRCCQKCGVKPCDMYRGMDVMLRVGAYGQCFAQQYTTQEKVNDK